MAYHGSGHVNPWNTSATRGARHGPPWQANGCHGKPRGMPSAIARAMAVIMARAEALATVAHGSVMAWPPPWHAVTGGRDPVLAQRGRKNITHSCGDIAKCSSPHKMSTTSQFSTLIGVLHCLQGVFYAHIVHEGRSCHL